VSIECQHGYLARACDQCDAEATIARLTRELEEARGDLKLAAGTTIEDALLVPRGALSQLRAERDEARQALEAERARVAELEHDITRHVAALSEANTECERLREAIEKAEHGVRCSSARCELHFHHPGPCRNGACNCWKSRALAAEGGEG